MARGVVPSPAPRKARALPWVAFVVGGIFGLGVFALLWLVAIELQKNYVPRPKAQTWESAP